GKRFINPGETLLLRSFNKINKYAGFYTIKVNEVADPLLIATGPYSFNGPLKADSAEQYVLQRANISGSELFAVAGSDLKNLIQLTDIASQQKEYNWLTV